jgi:hypothetical protein
MIAIHWIRSTQQRVVPQGEKGFYMADPGLSYGRFISLSVQLPGNAGLAMLRNIP